MEKFEIEDIKVLPSMVETQNGVCYKCGTEITVVDKFCPGCGEITQTKVEIIDRKWFLSEIKAIISKHIKINYAAVPELEDDIKKGRITDYEKPSACILYFSSANYDKGFITTVKIERTDGVKAKKVFKTSKGFFRRKTVITEKWVDDWFVKSKEIFEIVWGHSDSHPALQEERKWDIYVNRSSFIVEIKNIAKELENRYNAKIRIIL